VPRKACAGLQGRPGHSNAARLHRACKIVLHDYKILHGCTISMSGSVARMLPLSAGAREHASQRAHPPLPIGEVLPMGTLPLARDGFILPCP
jgi:hypothetical protein